MLYIYCGPMFRKNDFVEMLNDLGYKAEVKPEGFTFEKRLFELKPYLQPHWLWMNWDWLKRDSEEV